ncbi:MAG: hypothetical protein K2Y51_20095 [Gammaproteobacteria bacterium]|nr:hypothetical protein [Gammaproteobacteria bacterium]
MGNRTAILAVESGEGGWRRLMLDICLSDGVLPLALARLGDEAYVGARALAVACAEPDAVLETAHLGAEDADGGAVLARILAALASELRARLPEYTMSWAVLPLIPLTSGAWDRLALACWDAGLTQVTLCPAQLTLDGLVEASVPVAAVSRTANGARLELALLQGGETLVLDRTDRAMHDDDPLPWWRGGAAWTSRRNAAFVHEALRTAWSTAGESMGPALQESPRGATLDAAPLREFATCEARYWQSLDDARDAWRDALAPLDPQWWLLDTGQPDFALRARAARRGPAERATHFRLVAAEHWAAPTPRSVDDRATGRAVRLLLAGEAASVACRLLPTDARGSYRATAITTQPLRGVVELQFLQDYGDERWCEVARTGGVHLPDVATGATLDLSFTTTPVGVARLAVVADAGHARWHCLTDHAGRWLRDNTRHEDARHGQ